MDGNLQAALISIPHPLVADRREMFYEPFMARETLGAYIRRTGATLPNGPIAVWHNGFRVVDALWDRLIPRAGDQVIIRCRVEGSGGSNKVLRTVATLAVALTAVSAPYLAPAAWGTLGTTAAGATFVTGYGAALSAVVMVGGAMVISPLIPEPRK